MKVRVEYASILGLQGVENGGLLEIKQNTRVSDLLTRFHIREEHQRYIIPVVNGKSKKITYVLQDGDALYLMLPVGGG